MAPRTVLITGANRGIGLGLVRTYLKNQDIKHIFATSRKPSEAKELNEIKDPRLHHLQLDVQDDESIKKALAQVENIVGEDGLTLLINNAGMYSKYGTEKEINRSIINNILDANAVSVVIMIQYFLPLLKKASALDTSEKFSTDRAGIVNISSGMGSIGDNTTGSGEIDVLAYRMSKTAVNSITKTISIDLKKYHILVACFCPGWVKTDMGGPNAALTIDQSMDQLVPSISKLDDSHTGGYFKINLDVIPF
ncbi:unnamed protein product [Auanema sp. JU1783]|nr:unnamed protein product [Auanema sp. JU1783]